MFWLTKSHQGVFNNMAKKYRARMAREERATREGGIGETEEARKRRIKKEKGQALMRERAMK